MRKIKSNPAREALTRAVNAAIARGEPVVTEIKPFRWEVIVGNVGTVYARADGFKARAAYNTYVGQSKRGEGRAAGENVILMESGAPFITHYGTLEQED